VLPQPQPLFFVDALPPVLPLVDVTLPALVLPLLLELACEPLVPVEEELELLLLVPVDVPVLPLLLELELEPELELELLDDVVVAGPASTITGGGPPSVSAIKPARSPLKLSPSTALAPLIPDTVSESVDCQNTQPVHGVGTLGHVTCQFATNSGYASKPLGFPIEFMKRAEV